LKTNQNPRWPPSRYLGFCSILICWLCPTAGAYLANGLVSVASSFHSVLPASMIIKWPNQHFHQYLSISISEEDPQEYIIISDKKCYFLKAKFSHSQYSFGSEKNTTFFVYVYDFDTPVTIKVSFNKQL
jgi:hypothetical protein